MSPAEDLARRLLASGVTPETVTCFPAASGFEPDVVIAPVESSRLVEVFGRAIVRKNFHPRRQIENTAAAAAYARPGSIPATFHKKSTADATWIVALRLEDFVRILNERIAP
jgi:hypothetical protein